MQVYELVHIKTNMWFDVDRTIAIIGGTGSQGFGLALRWLKAGEYVIIGSRFRDKAQAKADEAREILGRGIRVEGSSNDEAASRADIIVLTVPFEAQLSIVKRIKPYLSDGKILVDVTVPLASSIGGDPWRILHPWDGSAAEQAARYAPRGVRVVSAFHTISSDILCDIDSEVDCDVLICGDDREAKRIVAELAEEIPGVRAVDCGPLENSRLTESLAPLMIYLCRSYGVKAVGIRIIGIPTLRQV